ncbi:MAG: hypothetical protein NTZ25_00615 [Candidatus Peregrinibacteria bacterium]|nr:hypothetical protein [Candidatus Peregrinibacteria bacterium]
MKDPRLENKKKLKKPLQDRFSPEYKGYIEELSKMEPNTHAQKIAKLARDGKIEPEVLKQVREILRNPNKMEKKEYQHFMKALSLGKFPKKAKYAMRFLQALDGTEKEKEYAVDLFKELSEESKSPLTERSEKDALKKLSDLREEDLEQKTISEISSAAKAVTETAGIKNMVEKAARTTPSNWKVEAAPEKLIEELDRLEIAQAELAERSNEVDRQFRLAKSAAKPDENLIERLKQELIKLDDEFDKLHRELSKPRLEYQNYLARNLARYRALEGFFKKAGVDVRTAERLRMWFFDLTSGKAKEGEKASLKLMGMEIDPVTGVTKKKEASIEITGLSFDTTDRSHIEADAAGEMIIEYKDQNGDTKVEGYKNFLQLLTAFEGYEEIDSLDDLNERSAEEFGYADIAVGQEYNADVLVGFDKEGKKINERHSFKIEGIDAGKKTITLDQSVTKVPREWIEFSVDNSLYFDRKQREFSFGEFAKFLKQHNYQRNVHIDETEAVSEKAKSREEAKTQNFMSGSSEKSKERFDRLNRDGIPKVDLPKSGEEKEVIFRDQNDLLRWGKLKREKSANGTENYVLEETQHHFNNGDATVTNLAEAGVPIDMAFTKRASSGWEESDGDARKVLAPLEVARMVRDGSIFNAPATRPAGNGKWTVKNQPNKMAAMELNDINAFDEEEEAAAHEEHAEHKADAHATDAHGGHDKAAHGDAHGHDEHGGDAHGDGHGHDDHGHGEHKAVNYREEALAIDQVRKVGGMKYGEKNYLKALWTNTRFLSMNDCWKMGKSMWEYYDRRWERRQKDKFARVGEELPYFSPEMRRIVEATEHEEVHQYQEAFEHKGIYEIQYRLENTSNKDELKATLVTLSDKGQLRLDSIPFWKNINKFVPPSRAIPIPANGDPSTMVSSTDPRTGLDFLKPAIDSIWGEGTFDGFYSKNKSAYASNAKGFYEEGKQLEGLDGGHSRRLGILLQQHKQGIYVNPHEYEGLILHSIEAGKSSMQAKIYYMIEGVAAYNHDGRTIMPFDRIAHINSEMLAQFPILEYITARVPRKPKGEVARFNLEDYKQWVHWFDNGHPSDPGHHSPSTFVDEFMWKYVIPSDETENRINKAIRNGEKLDHDDMFAYLPPANYQVVSDACKATTGNKKFLTIEGYANVFPGFSQYMRSTAAMGRKVKLREAIKSYVRFEGIMTRRFQKTDDAKDPYQRMSRSTLTSRTIVTETPPQAFIDQITPAVKAIAQAYNDPKLNAVVAQIFSGEVEDIYSDAGKKQQQQMNLAYENFNKIFDDVVKSDNGEKMQSIILGANLEGMPEGVSDEEKAKRKASFVDKSQLT